MVVEKMSKAVGNKVYLKQFLDASDSWSLPAELHRNMNLMTELDQRTHDNLQEVDGLEKKYIEEVRQLSPAERTEQLEKIQALFKKCLEYADDKVQLAYQTYEMIDRRVRNLDNLYGKSGIKSMKPALRAALSPASTSSQMSSPSLKSDKKKRSKPVSSGESDTPSEKKMKKGQKVAPSSKGAETLGPLRVNTGSAAGADGTGLSDSHLSMLPAGLPTPDPVLMNMPVNPYEPTYCLCHQVSYGEMVGCDNPDCQIEWFHFGCVGLSSKPTGEWYCPRCAPEAKKSRIPTQ